MQILGIKVDNLSRAEILEKVKVFLSEDNFHQIATINPEFILEAQKDAEFKNVLNNCDLNVADGVGLRFAFWRNGEKLKARIAGADMMDEILYRAEKNNHNIFLAANNGGLSTWEETRDAILKRYPGLKIGGSNLEKNSARYELQITDYAIVFCNFGAPYQEKFLHSLKSLKNSKIKLGIGVGGSFDYLTGKIRRAPKFARRCGLEWLWRLIQQPKRFKRIFRAIIIFPIKIIFSAKGGSASG